MPLVIINGAHINVPDTMTSSTAGLPALNTSSHVTNFLQSMSLPAYLTSELREGRGALEVSYTATSKDASPYRELGGEKKGRRGVRCKLNGRTATYEVAIQYRDAVANKSYPLFDLTFKHSLPSRDVSLKDTVEKTNALIGDHDREIAAQNQTPLSQFLQHAWAQATLTGQKNMSAAVEARLREDRTGVEEIQSIAAIPDEPQQWQIPPTQRVVAEQKEDRESARVLATAALAAAEAATPLPPPAYTAADAIPLPPDAVAPAGVVEQTPNVKALQEKLAEVHQTLASLATAKQRKYVGKAAAGQMVSQAKWAKLQTLQDLVQKSMALQQLADNVQSNVPSVRGNGSSRST